MLENGGSVPTWTGCGGTASLYPRRGVLASGSGTSRQKAGAVPDASASQLPLPAPPAPPCSPGVRQKQQARGLRVSMGRGDPPSLLRWAVLLSVYLDSGVKLR
jgi:hypothetical protein